MQLLRSLKNHWFHNSHQRLVDHTEMIPHDNTHFRFRFSVVLFLVFLLTSPTQASSAAACAGVAQTLNGASLGKNPQLLRNFADCVNGAKKEYSEIKGIMTQVPGLIDEVLPFAKKEGLVLLSVYLLYKSFELFDEAKILEVNSRIDGDKLGLLQKEMKPYRNFIDTELIPQWEKGNTANLEKITDRLLQRMGHLATEIQELTQDIRRDYKMSGSKQRFSAFLGAGGSVLCVYPLVSATPYLSIPVCVVALGYIGFSWRSYTSLQETLSKLEKLENDATKMSEEFTSYQVKLDLTKMRAELRGEL